MSSQLPSQNSNRTSRAAVSQQTTSIGGTAPQSRPPGDAFTRVINKFRARLTGPEFTAIGATTYEELCQTLSRVQQDQQLRMESMNLARIQGFLEAMQQLSKVIEVFLNVSNVVAFVWGPIKFLLLTASTFADSFETLLDAYEQIGEQLPLLAEYESLFHKSPRIIKVLEKIYTDILDFHQQCMQFFTGKLWTRFFRSMWKDFNTKFNGILKTLGRHRVLLESQAHLVQYLRYQEDSQASLVGYRKYEEGIKELKTKLEDIIVKEQMKKKVAVKQWLSVGEQPERDHTDYCNIRGECATTTDWILQHESVKHWIESDIPSTPLLWMNGIPGAGKTILASTIIERCKQKTDFTTCYFYCHYGDQTTDSAIGIVKGLAGQLLDQHPQMLPHCYTKRMSSGEPSLRSPSHAKRLLEDFCDTIPKLFIVVDGLDECEAPERKQFLEILTEIVRRGETADPGQLRLLVVSQDYPDIRRGLRSSGAAKVVPLILRITDADNRSDIEAYSRMYVNRIAKKFSPFGDDMNDYLRNLTVSNADGMFLYAKLVLVNLYAMPTRADLIDAIQANQFPKGLAGAYERILHRIKITLDDKWPKARKLLGWLVCAKRRLTWKEIQVALSIDIRNQIIDYDNHSMRDHIYDTCGSLVLVNGDRVSLVHNTAKKYITKITEDIHEPSIECELATLCLHYLTFPCFDIDDSQDDNELRRLALEGQFAFQDYAVAKWFHNVNAWAGNGSAFLNEAIDQQVQLGGILKAMDEFMDRYSEVDWETELVDDCKESCSVFKPYALHDHFVQLTSHIYTFQQKGFEARHKISIEGLTKALERNRKILEDLPKQTHTLSDRAAYNRFYDEETRFKCTRITCRFFSEGFKDERSGKRHVNNHDRPFQCDDMYCFGADGYTHQKDLEKHTRAFHPELSDLADNFSSAIKHETNHVCTICGQTFARNFSRKNHELAHLGKRPFECAECGKAFTRANDLKRHQKIHERAAIA